MPLYFSAHYSAIIYVSSLKTPCLRSQILCVYFSVVLSGCTKALLMFVFSIESVQCFLSSIHKLFQFNKVENIIQTNPVKRDRNRFLNRETKENFQILCNLILNNFFYIDKGANASLMTLH